MIELSHINHSDSFIYTLEDVLLTKTHYYNWFVYLFVFKTCTVFIRLELSWWHYIYKLGWDFNDFSKYNLLYKADAAVYDQHSAINIIHCTGRPWPWSSIATYNNVSEEINAAIPALVLIIKLYTMSLCFQ